MRYLLALFVLIPGLAHAQEIVVSAVYTPPQPDPDGHHRAMPFIPALETGSPDWPIVPNHLLRFTEERVDRYDAWDGSTFTAPIDGWYEVSFSLTVRLMEPVTEREKVTVFLHRNNLYPTTGDFPWAGWSVYLDNVETEQIFSGAPSMVPLQAGDTVTISMLNLVDVELDFWQFVTWINIKRLN